MVLQTPKPEPRPIPPEWRKVVRAILRGRNRKSLLITDRAVHEWSMAFPDAYLGDLYETLERTLADDGILGRRVPDMRPPGEAYEFMFFHEGVRLYGKVNLILPDRKAALVVSAHLPNKGDTL